MTVYCEERKKKPGQKKAEKFWRVDITWETADGRKLRIRKIPRPNTKVEGEKLERSILKALADGTWFKKQEAPAETLASFREQYFKNHVSGLKPSMRSAQETIWRISLLPELGALPLAEIGEAALAKLIGAMRERGAQPKTINNALSALRTALTYARRWKLVATVPEVRWVKSDPKRIEFFDDAEVQRIVAQGSPMVTVALKTGMRIGELLALRWPDVSFDRGEITVDKSVFFEKGEAHQGSTKTQRIRHLPMTPELAAILRAHRELANDKRGYVFTTEEGKQLTRNMAKWRLWPVLKAAGVRKTGWHVCRHTFASHLVMQGAPLASVQKLMGHTTIQMTMRYAHLAPGHLRDVMSLLEPKAAPDSKPGSYAHPMPN